MRLGLAAFGAVLIGGIAVGLAVLGSTDSTTVVAAARSAGCGSRRARFASGLALHSRRPCRRRRSHCRSHTAASRHAPTSRPASTTSRGRELSRGRGARSSPAPTARRRVQTKAGSGADACADPELRRDREDLRLPAARHRRRRRAEPLHAVGQPPLRDLHEDGQRRSASTLPGNALWAGNPNAPVCAARQRRRPDRPLRPVLGPLVRLAVRVPELPERAVLPVRRGLDHERPVGHLVRLRVPGVCDEAERLSEVRRLADPERLHGHDQPVHRARLTTGAASASSPSSATR